MSILVIDASITLSWLLPDEAGAASAAVHEELLSADQVWVPSHWRLEICNSLCIAERRKRLDARSLALAVALVAQLPVIVDPDTDPRAGSDTMALARQHALSVYDAAYLELALRRGAAVASLDAPLRAVAGKLGIPLLPDRLSGESLT